MSADHRADVLVVGVGGVGANVLHALAARGVSAIGIDRFEPGHDRGSSHGDTRVIRKAYFEHPDYVPLLDRAYDAWRALEDETGEPLLDQCGLILTGPPHGAVITGVDLAADRHGVAVERWSREDVADRVPWLRMPDGHEARWEPDGGYLAVERCVRTAARRAVELGAQLRVGEAVLSWSAGESGVRIETDRATYEADRLVLSPGAWAPALFPEVAATAGLHVLRKVLLWMPAPGEPRPDTTFFVEGETAAYYGFPSIDGATVKLAEHSGGEPITDPLTVDRGLHHDDVAPAVHFTHDVLPGLGTDPVRHAVCMYTMTSDAHFVLDHHPGLDRVVVAAGFSGHGFKFFAALGPILADLAVDGRTDAPIDFLGLARFGV